MRAFSVKRLLPRAALGGAALLLAACVVVPQGPSQQALPGSRRSFEQFSQDDAGCRQYAQQMAGGDSVRNANDAAVGSAVAGALIGGAAGALMGGHGGAGVGAGMGLIVGSAVGASTAQASYYGTQRQFDGAYHQCMYSRGHKVPSYGAPAPRRASPQDSRYAPPAYPSVPPPNAPPPAAYSAVPPPNAPPPYYAR